MSKFYEGQLVEIVDCNDDYYIGQCGEITQREDRSMENFCEAYHVELDDENVHFYAECLRPLPPFSFKFSKIKEIEST